MRCLSCHHEISQEITATENCPGCNTHLPTLLRDLLPPGHMLQGGKYQLESALGRGGFGVTYLARHLVLGKQVAIKEYFPQEHSHRLYSKQNSFSLQARSMDQAFERGLQRFLREGKLLGQLRHPGIVQIEDFFEENNTAYLVMEYLEGQTLKTWLAQQGGKLPADEVQRLGAQLVSALASVHAAEIYHLDIKPENIVLQGQQLKLIDFGSARPADGHSQSTRSLTLQYAAPEIIARYPVGPYSDIFELAMVLHELLTGSPPPEAIQRLMKPWEPADLPEPWQDLLGPALKMNSDERPQEIVAWWEAVFGPLAAPGQEAVPAAWQARVTALEAQVAEQQESLESLELSFGAGFEAQQESLDELESALAAQKKSHTALLTTVQNLSELIHNRLGMAFVLIQPGSFIMGSPEDEKGRSEREVLHKVTLTRPFYLQNTPVTQSQWQAVMGENPSYFKGLDRPVECVSWEDCQVFIQKLNAQGLGHYRLPTEAEWEYACRAGTTTPFGIGNGVDLDSSQANFDGNYPYGKGKEGIFRKETTPVKSFAPNAWGLYDMHGNVWEWCQDWYGKYSSGAVTDPSGPETGSRRVFRGGSCRNAAQSLRSAYRYNFAPGHRFGDLGLRLVRRP